MEQEKDIFETLVDEAMVISLLHETPTQKRVSFERLLSAVCEYQRQKIEDEVKRNNKKNGN